MSLVAVVSVVFIGAGYAAVAARKALRTGTKPRDLAFYGTCALCGGGGLLIYLLLFSSMLGDGGYRFLLPSVFGSKAERFALLLYGIGSAGISALATAGLACITSKGEA